MRDSKVKGLRGLVVTIALAGLVFGGVGCGSDGDDGANGLNGMDGMNGATGPSGPAGQDGIDATALPPADTYFALAVTNNSHNHAGDSLLFLDFDGDSGVAAGEKVIHSTKVAPNTIRLDGNDSEWAAATTLSTVKGVVQNSYPLSSAYDAVDTDITVGAVYDDDYIYFLVQWEDAGWDESVRRNEWEHNGASWSRKALLAPALGSPGDSAANSPNVNLEPNSPFGSESEDRIFFFFPIVDGAGEFQDGGLGCAAWCHSDLINSTDPTQVGSHTGDTAYMSTGSGSDMGDTWHWKGARTAPMGFADDKHIVSGAGNGRKSDWGSSVDFTNRDGTGAAPAFMHYLGLTENPKSLMYFQAVPVMGAPGAGDTIPYSIMTVPTGSRGDVQTQHSYDAATDVWTVEFRRLRNTGSWDDYQFVPGTDATPPTVTTAVTGSAAIGATTYTSKGCDSCHGSAGEGVWGGAAWTFPRVQRSSASLILKGSRDEAAMSQYAPGGAQEVTPQEAADMAKWLQEQWTEVP